MATSYLTSTELNNLGNVILHRINQHKGGKKGAILIIFIFIAYTKKYLQSD